jgi:hypothetical protein
LCSAAFAWQPCHAFFFVTIDFLVKLPGLADRTLQRWHMAGFYVGTKRLEQWAGANS